MPIGPERCLFTCFIGSKLSDISFVCLFWSCYSAKNIFLLQHLGALLTMQEFVVGKRNHINGINKTDWPLIICNPICDFIMPAVSVSSTAADLKSKRIQSHKSPIGLNARVIGGTRFFLTAQNLKLFG